MEPEEFIQTRFDIKGDTDIAALSHTDWIEAMKECAAQEAVGFAEWIEKLDPIKRFTVHPPAGSGASTGLYRMSYSDLYAIYKKGGEGV